MLKGEPRDRTGQISNPFGSGGVSNTCSVNTSIPYRLVVRSFDNLLSLEESKVQLLNIAAKHRIFPDRRDERCRR